MIAPSRVGLINWPEKGDLAPLAAFRPRTHARSELVKAPRKPSAATQMSLFPEKQSSVRRFSRAWVGDPAYMERREMEAHRMKRCITCKTVKPYGEFGVVPLSSAKNKTIGGVWNECKDCKSARQKRTHMKLKYGVSEEDYTAMYEAQDRKCAICGIPGKSRLTLQSAHKRTGTIPGTLVVDHDHTTGKVRALLCSACNLALGGLRDDLELFRKAMAYIEYHRP
jgi:Recombination endonuclease VII